MAKASKKTKSSTASKKKTAAKKKPVKSTAAKAQPAQKPAPSSSVQANGINPLLGIAPTDFMNNYTSNLAMEKVMTQSKTQMDKLTQDAANMSREGAEAFSKSLGIFAKGFEDIMRTSVSLAQNAAEKQAEYAKEIMGSKTINEFAEVQTRIAQANFDDFMAGATQISELSTKVLTEASEPLNKQATKAVKKASEAMAA